MEIPPFLFIFSFFLIIAVSSTEFPSPPPSSDEAAFWRIPDSQVEEDMKAVERAIQSPWVEEYPSGIKRMETKRESFSLTDAQKALFNRHWELETIQREKPGAPKQFDLGMFADALKLMLEIDPKKKTVLIWTHKLREWMEAKRGEGGNAEEEEMPETVEEKGKGENEEERAKSANLSGQEGGEEIQMEGQCSEADRPAILTKMGDPSNQTAVQMPIQAMEPPPSMAPPSIQAAMQQGNYLNGVDGFGRPMVLIMEPNNISNGLEGKLEGQAQNGQKNIQTNIAENWEGQKEQQSIVNEGNGGIMYVVDEGNGGEGENAKIGEKSGEEFGVKKGEKGEENKGEEDKKEKEILASSEEGANEKTVFEAIRGQKKEGEGSEEKEDGKGRILVIDWANGGGKEEENGEDNVEEISRKLGAMKMVKMEEELNSEEQMTSPNGDVVEVEMIKPIKEEKDQKKRTNPGLLGILSEMLFSRKKREVIMMGEKADALGPTMPIPAAILGNKQDEQMPAPITMPVAPEGVFANETILVNEGEKGEEGDGTEKKGRTIKLIRSFKGRLAMGKARLGISAKWEMMVNEQKEAENEKKEENNEEEVQQKKEMTNQKDEPSGIKEEEEGENMEKTKTSGSSVKNEKGNAERVSIKMTDEKADLVKYLEWYLVKTNGPKREEKLAYVLYSELQYWLAKQIEKKFDGNGKDVHQILDETPSNKEENQMDYLRSKWSNTIARLEILTKMIGKDFRRK